MKYEMINDEIIFRMEGKIDTSNSMSVQNEVMNILHDYPNGQKVVFDFKDISYISSSGLRMVLFVKKEYDNFKIINVSLEVYEIFDMTGFTSMINVEKRYREISIEGCDLIGEGSEGLVYRLNPDTICKVFKFDISQEALNREIEVSKKAFILGIPTAIAFDIVKVNGKFGLVFELINSKSLCKQYIKDNSKFNDIVDFSVRLYQTLQSIQIPKGYFPDGIEKGLELVDSIKHYLSDDIYQKLYHMVESLKVRSCLVHGDSHIKNVMSQDGNPILIDLESVTIGNPIFEYGGLCQSYVIYQETDYNNGMEFFGIKTEVLNDLYYSIMERLFPDSSKRENNLKKICIIGSCLVLHNVDMYEDGKNIERINNCLKHINEYVPIFDNLDLE